MTKRTLLVLAALLAAGSAGWILHRKSAGGPQAAPRATKGDAYQCSMHPQIVSDRPGDCPICRMKLTRVEPSALEARPDSQAGRKRKILFYRHPMNPEVTSAAPAKDEMGMDYIPVYSNEAEETEDPALEGHASFSLSAERQQLIGVQTLRIEKKPLSMEIRSVGRVAYDPELYNALSEYREAAGAKAKLPEDAAPEIRERTESLLRAAALRLRVMGISDSELSKMSHEAADATDLLLPGKSVWVYAQIYENEADLVRPGQKADVSLPSSREKTYAGKVVSVDPVIDAMTRTIRARIKVETPQERLKPESFVNAVIQVPMGTVLAVPEDAVLDTGESQIVFVKSGEGRFEPRAVAIGREAGGQYEILAGIREGEEVVTSANFLIDSESRFRSAVSSFSGKKPQSGPDKDVRSHD